MLQTFQSPATASRRIRIILRRTFGSCGIVGVGTGDGSFIISAPVHHSSRARGPRIGCKSDDNCEIPGGWGFRQRQSSRDYTPRRDNGAFLTDFAEFARLKYALYNCIFHDIVLQHVTAGHRWFSWVCEADGVDPVATFREQVRLHFSGAIKGPFNEADRRKAGMTPDFYEDLRGR